MCAECHSTDVAKNYDAKTGRFDTTWKEISVGCEACHGQGSAHVAWAKDWSPFGKDDAAKGLLARFDERGRRHLDARSQDRSTQSAALRRRSLRKEVEMCGRCHARRGIISEDFVPGRPLSDSHASSLCSGAGSTRPTARCSTRSIITAQFKQSKMFAGGSDLQRLPRSAQRQAEAKGDASLPAMPRGQLRDGGAHPSRGRGGAVLRRLPHAGARLHGHRPAPRSLFPRAAPRSLGALGADNACTDCHTDKSAQWAAASIEEWFGPERKGFQTFGPAFHAAWTGAPDAQALLAAVAGDPGTRRLRPRQRARGADRLSVGGDRGAGARRARRPRSAGAHRRARSSGGGAAGAALAAGFAAARRFRCAACASRRGSCSPVSRLRISRRPTARG